MLSTSRCNSLQSAGVLPGWDATWIHEQPAPGPGVGSTRR